MKHGLLFVLFLGAFSVSAQLRINELMTNNVSFNLDDSFNYSMWAEVINVSQNSENASGYWFSDQINNPFQWKPADTLVAAGGYHLFYFERSDKPGHANFKLRPEGGTLYLFDNGGHLVDSMSYPVQYRNISYGRVKEGSVDKNYFTEPTPGAVNAAKAVAGTVCAPPVPSLKGGFYPNAQTLRFQCESSDTVYYTTDCSEPTRLSTRFFPLSPLSLPATTVVRARTFSKGKIPGPIVTNTYFINLRNHQLPVVSISTTQANLTDPKTGIYCDGDGTNGVLSRYETVKKNYYADWSRPINFELYDSARVQRINQEADTKILGGWTRRMAAKSLAISPKKKFGSTKLDYDFFKASKPNHKYKDIQVRNSGNDFSYSMFRDGLMQTIVKDRLPALDYMAYEPAVMYLNGQYWGIENLRERSNENWVYSNYGLDEEDVYTVEGIKDQDTDKDMATDTAFLRLCDYLRNNDPAQSQVYAALCKKIDTDNFMAYMIAELYTANSDWPNNNQKLWRRLPDRAWHWILSDLDFGMSLYSSNEASNMLLVAMGESGDRPEWSTIVFKTLLRNPTFLNTFIDRFTVHLSTTFATDRVCQLIDSLSAKISGEIAYHKAKFGSSRAFAADLALMKAFAAARPVNMLNFIASRFLNAAPLRKIQLNSTLEGVAFRLNNEWVPDGNAVLQAYKGRTYTLEAVAPKGYVFSHWEKKYLGVEDTILSKGSLWSYYDGASLPDSNWQTTAYQDKEWASGQAPLGYGNKGESTVISYGSNAGAKYPTAYFRTHFTATDLTKQSNFRVNILADDGAVVYINGTEVGRLNLPAGTVTFNTYTSTSNNGVSAVFSIPSSLINSGENLIAVEVHQCNATSSDLLFDLNVVCEKAEATPVVRLSDVRLVETLDRPVELDAFFDKTTEPEVVQNVMFINEILPSNSLLTDEFGEKDDAVELYNASDKPVDINGWYLSDDAVNLKKAQIPPFKDGSTLVPAKGYLVFWADDTPGQGALHLPFKLSASGETILLSRPAGLTVECVDSATYGNLNSNESWSRIYDASPFWAVRPPTLGISNGKEQALPESGFRETVNVWPTAFSDRLHVICPANSKLVLYDLNGRIYFTRTVSTTEDVLDTGRLPDGFYFMRVKNRLFKLIKH